MPNTAFVLACRRPSYLSAGRCRTLLPRVLQPHLILACQRLRRSSRANGRVSPCVPMAAQFIACGMPRSSWRADGRTSPRVPTAAQFFACRRPRSSFACRWPRSSFFLAGRWPYSSSCAEGRDLSCTLYTTLCCVPKAALSPARRRPLSFSRADGRPSPLRADGRTVFLAC
jgi:hypothetical protein